MDTHTTSNEIQIELTDEVAQGTYVNLAVIAHSEDEFVFDFIRLVPGVPKAKVKCRLIMTADCSTRWTRTCANTTKRGRAEVLTTRTRSAACSPRSGSPARPKRIPAHCAA